MRSQDCLPSPPPRAALGLDLAPLLRAAQRGRAADVAARATVEAAVKGGIAYFDGPPGIERLIEGAGNPRLSIQVADAREHCGGGPNVDLMLDGAALLRDEARWTAALAPVDQGLCGRVGVTVGPGGDALGLARRFKPELMQVACGLLDQRPIASGATAEIAAMGVELHLRTALLHGLLFLPREALPVGLADAGPLVSRARRMIAEAGADPLQAALAFALHRPEADAVIVEAGSPGEVRALLAAAARPLPDLDWPALALDHAPALDAEAQLYRRIAA